MIEYFLGKNWRKLRLSARRMKQRYFSPPAKVLRYLSVFYLSFLVLGVQIPSASPAAQPLPQPSVRAESDSPAGEPTLTSNPAGEVKGERTFKALAETSGRGPQRIPDSPDPPALTAASALFLDRGTETVLLEKNSQLPWPPASTTKLMTALLAVEDFSLEEVVTVPAECVALTGTQKMGLFSGEKISVASLVEGLLISSAGDAACALAQHQGAAASFVAKMNERAATLGMKQTKFTNPVGFDGANGEGQQSTAAEILLLSRAFLEHSFLRQAAAQTEKTVTSLDGKTSHFLKTTNDLLRSYPGTAGVKTGYTAKAKGCFVSLFRRGEREVLGVLLGSDDRFGETQEVLEWIFSVYRWP